MIDARYRLQFSDIYSEAAEPVTNYLTRVSKNSLLKIIGFCNTTPPPNFDNFFSNPHIQSDIINRVNLFLRESNINNKPYVISRLASLKLAEFIFSQEETLLLRNENTNTDDDTNLFKAFLIINSDLNENQFHSSNEDEIENAIETCIINLFPVSDMGILKNTDLEFFRLSHATIVKLKYLFEFLNTNHDLNIIKNQLLESFGKNNEEDFFREMKYLFAQLLGLKTRNNYLFHVENEESISFLNTIVSQDISNSEDFTNFKNSPLYIVSENTYSIIDYFFVIDRFYKSIKFKIKDLYNVFYNLSPNNRNFFSFFNLEFSEKFLMKKALDGIFNKRYHIRKIENQLEGEPDYYIRHNNTIYLFENKDILIAGGIKASGNLQRIDKTLKSKLLIENNRNVGIGQLVERISEIISNDFNHDPYVNNKKNITIYPILLLHERIFETPGLNYRLNKWYLESLKSKLGENYNPNFIKNLILIDIDTVIYFTHHFNKNERNFNKALDLHLKKMNVRKKVSHSNPVEALRIANKNLAQQIAPFSNRLPANDFPTEIFVDEFRNILPD